MGDAITKQTEVPSKTLRRTTPPAVTVLLVVMALVARVLLVPYESEDAATFLLPWMEQFRDHGVWALGGDFSNYNFPYLFLLFMVSFLPIDPLIAIKIVSIAGDVSLALAVAALAKELGPSRLAPRTVAVISLLAPTVLVNGAMWGQCDSIYTALLLLSARSLLRNNYNCAWSFWGVAVAFKLQAVFFLPALAAISLRGRFNIRGVFMAAFVWLALSLPPVIFGRSWESTLTIYVRQTQDNRLVSGAANIFAMFPTLGIAEGRWWGIMLCAVAIGIAVFAYWRGEDVSERRLLLCITTVAVCPLLLPQMHDRYFFAAEVMSLLLLNWSRLRMVPCLLATTGAFVYFLYFAKNSYALPLSIAFLVQTVAALLLYRALMRHSENASRGSVIH